MDSLDREAAVLRRLIADRDRLKLELEGAERAIKNLYDLLDKDLKERQTFRHILDRLPDPSDHPTIEWHVEEYLTEMVDLLKLDPCPMTTEAPPRHVFQRAKCRVNEISLGHWVLDDWVFFKKTSLNTFIGRMEYEIQQWMLKILNKNLPLNTMDLIFRALKGYNFNKEKKGD